MLIMELQYLGVVKGIPGWDGAVPNTVSICDSGVYDFGVGSGFAITAA